jgi:hypothetical protein
MRDGSYEAKETFLVFTKQEIESMRSTLNRCLVQGGYYKDEELHEGDQDD